MHINTDLNNMNVDQLTGLIHRCSAMLRWLENDDAIASMKSFIRRAKKAKNKLLLLV
jgi:hypothetical protein